jgi:hypothetical protein
VAWVPGRGERNGRTRALKEIRRLSLNKIILGRYSMDISVGIATRLWAE